MKNIDNYVQRTYEKVTDIILVISNMEMLDITIFYKPKVDNATRARFLIYKSFYKISKNFIESIYDNILTHAI